MLGHHPDLWDGWEQAVGALKDLLSWFVLGVLEVAYRLTLPKIT